MAEKPNPSIQDILAACRKSDGDGSAAAESAPAAEPQAAETSTAAAAPAKKAAEMSVAEMMAAARAEKAAGAKTSAGDAAAKASPSKPAAAAKDPTKMSVQEMLAAARAEKEAKAAAPQAAKAAAPKTAKPQAGAAKAKTSPKSSTKAAPNAPLDTSSILAAARGAAKPGPMSKAEAAAKTKPDAAAAPKAKTKAAAPPMPAKPSFAKPSPKAAAKASEDRRSFLSIFLGSFLAIGFTTLTMTGGLWTLGVARFFFPNLLIEPPNRFKVGFPADFAAGMVETKFKAQFGVWVVNADYDGQPEIFALKTVCTHLGCTPNWLEAEQKFKCPCHGSGFYKDGVNFEGPAPRPLERYAISVADDGQLEIDKSKTFQEQLGQWNDPGSYVPA